MSWKVLVTPLLARFVTAAFPTPGTFDGGSVDKATTSTVCRSYLGEVPSNRCSEEVGELVVADLGLAWVVSVSRHIEVAAIPWDEGVSGSGHTNAW